MGFGRADKELGTYYIFGSRDQQGGLGQWRSEWLGALKDKDIKIL